MNGYVFKVSINKLLYAFLYLFIIDGVFHISRGITVAGIQVRECWFVIMIMISFLQLFKNKYWLYNKYSILVISMLSIVGIAIVRPFFDNNTLEYISDLVAEFSYYFYLSILLFAINNEKKLRGIISLICVLGTILSFLSIFVVFGNIAMASLSNAIVEISNSMQFLNIYNNFGIVTRVMWTGVVFQIAALFILFTFWGEYRKTLYMVLMLVNIFALIFTYARGIIAGSIVGMAIYIYIQSKSRLEHNVNIIKMIMVLSVVILIAVGVLFVTYSDFITFLVERFMTTDVATSNSDALRDDMVDMLSNLIAENPIWGSGASGHIALRDGRVEMTYHDILSKMGIVGLVIFILPYIFIIWDSMNKFREETFTRMRIGLIATLTAVLFATYSNPYILGSLGLLIYCLCMRVCIEGHNSIKSGDG